MVRSPDSAKDCHAFFDSLHSKGEKNVSEEEEEEGRR